MLSYFTSTNKPDIWTSMLTSLTWQNEIHKNFLSIPLCENNEEN